MSSNSVSAYSLPYSIRIIRFSLRILWVLVTQSHKKRTKYSCKAPLSPLSLLLALFCLIFQTPASKSTPTGGGYCPKSARKKKKGREKVLGLGRGRPVLNGDTNGRSLLYLASVASLANKPDQAIKMRENKKKKSNRHSEPEHPSEHTSKTESDGFCAAYAKRISTLCNVWK